MNTKACEILKEYGYWDFVDIEKIVLQMWIVLEEVKIHTKWVYGYSCKRFGRDFILVKENSYPKYKRYVIAHELGHIVHDDKLRANRWYNSFCDFIEQRADQFAMDMLIPDTLLREKLKDTDDVSVLSSELWVPRKLIERKMKILFP